MHALPEILGRLKALEKPAVLATLVAPVPGSPLRLGSRRLMETRHPTDELERLALEADRPHLATLPSGETFLLEPLLPGRLAPWIHFAAQQQDLGRTCVPAAVLEVHGALPYQVGETFALDEHSHGLVPMDSTLNAALHHACARAREEGLPRIERLLVPGGELTLLFDPVLP
jgi:hypothetical protein